MPTSAIERLTQHFDVHGAGVAITTDDERAYAAMSEFMAPFVAHDAVATELSFEISTTPRREEPAGDAQEVWDAGYFRMSKSGSRRYVWAKDYGSGEADLATAAGRIWTEGWGENYTWGTTRLLFLPLWAMLLKTTGRFTIHAAGVARNGRALLFPVRSGGGKSTLTMNLAQAGYELLSDDTQFLIPTNGTVRIAPFTEPIALRKGSLAFFPEFEAVAMGEGHRVRIDPEREGMSLVRGTVAPGVIAFPIVTGERESSAERVSNAEALQRLIVSSFFFTDQAVLDEHLRTLSALVAASRCYRLNVGTDRSSLVSCIERMESES